MAKIECEVKGDFYGILTDIETAIERSVSATREDSSFFKIGDTLCAVRVYERYSYWGGNRVSLNLTLLQKGDKMWLSAITSGGSQAMFFKLNTIGEESFLDSISSAVDKYRI